MPKLQPWQEIMKDRPPLRQPYFLPQIPPPSNPSNLNSARFNLNSKVSPSILLIIIILAVAFFVAGLLHLLVRFLLRPPGRHPHNIDDATAFQGQLQQLFDLHDAGVDQSYIDPLPVFAYKAIIGVKNPFDCAVCLCEFEADDDLRLLPQCSHAFHMDCIDTWLLSHSTCPLCRSSLLPQLSTSNRRSPIVLVLESGGESSREINAAERSASIAHFDEEIGLSRRDLSRKSTEIQLQLEEKGQQEVVRIKLGKFRNIDVGSSGNNNAAAAAAAAAEDDNGRRCFSMGSFEYVVDESSSLEVPLRASVRKRKSVKKRMAPGHRQAMSECDCDSRRRVTCGLEAFGSIDVCTSDGVLNVVGDHDPGVDSGIGIGRSKRESFSVSKIWMRGKREGSDLIREGYSRRAFSFRFPLNDRSVLAADGLKADKGLRADIEVGCGEENQSRDGFDKSHVNSNSQGRWTPIWLIGRQNKVVHSSSISSG